MIAAIAAAALLLVAGLLLGTPGRAFDPVVPVDGPPLMKTLGYAVIIVILGAAHQDCAELPRQTAGRLRSVASSAG